MKILIVHASRGRPLQAKKIYDLVYSTSSKKNIILYTLCLDMDDPELAKYKDLFEGFAELIVDNNNGCVQATNRAYNEELIRKHAFVIIASDDIYFPENWDTELIKIFDKCGYDKVIKTTNQYQGDLDLLNLPIGGAQFFIDYKTFFWPEYISMYADSDMTSWAKINNRYIKASHLLFPHMQYQLSMPKEITEKYGDIPPIDATYEKENSRNAWNVGTAVFNKRRKEKFKI